MHKSFSRSIYLWLLIFNHNAGANISHQYQLAVFNPETNITALYRLISTVNRQQNHPNKTSFSYILKEILGPDQWEDPPDYLKPQLTPISARVLYNSESIEDLLEKVRLTVPDTIIPWGYTIVSFVCRSESIKGFQHAFMYLSMPIRTLFHFSSLLSHENRVPPAITDWTAVIRDSNQLEHTLIVIDDKLHSAYGQLSHPPHQKYQLTPVNKPSRKKIMRCQPQAKPINLITDLYRKLSSKFWLIASFRQQ